LLSALHMTLQDPRLKQYVDDILEQLCEHKIIKHVDEAREKCLEMASASQTVASFRKPPAEDDEEDDDEDEDDSLGPDGDDHHLTRLPRMVPPQPAFSPSSTPLDLTRRFLCWNHMGSVTLLQGDHRRDTNGNRKTNTNTNTTTANTTITTITISIISTSKGMMTDKEARRLNVGGEILCTVY